MESAGASAAGRSGWRLTMGITMIDVADSSSQADVEELLGKFHPGGVTAPGSSDPILAAAAASFCCSHKWYDRETAVSCATETRHAIAPITRSRPQ